MNCNLFPDQADPNNEDDFRGSGPSYLGERIDWENTDHKRCVASSLVNGVYILERQRQQECQATQALASLWWECFGFMLFKKLIDDEGRIFGAVFIRHGKDPTYGSPGCVIAFRGTLISSASDIQKISINSRFQRVKEAVRYFLAIVQNSLHLTPSFEVAMKAVRHMVGQNGDSNVWLTGHSFGAAMGMLAGKTMAKEGSFLEAFLFNPPYLSSPIERIKSKKVKFVLRCGSTVLKAGLLPFATFASKKGNGNEGNLLVAKCGLLPFATSPSKKGNGNGNEWNLFVSISGLLRFVTSASKKGNGNGNEGNLFVAISGWIPRLFVNRKDGVCSEYIGYFEHRKKMEEIGAGNIASFDSQHSLANLAMKVAGLKGVETADPLHLLPSANLIVNPNPSSNVFKAHELCQWWMPNLNLNCSVYKY